MGGAEVRIRKLQSVQTQNAFDLTIAGNTVGAGGILVSSGTLTLVGGNNITLSQDGGNIITISGGAGGAGASFDAGVSNLGNTLGTTGTVSNEIVFVGGNNITLSQSSIVGHSATITINAFNQSVQTQSIIQDVNIIGNIAGVTADISSGTLFLAGGNSITLSQNGNSVTISGASTSQSEQTQNVVDVTLSGNTSGALALISSGTLTLAGGNNITLSQAGNAVTISGPNTVAQSIQPAVGSLNGSSGTLTIEAGTNITISNNASTISVIGPSNILNSFSIGGNTGTTGSSAISGGGFVLAGGSNITLSQSNATITIHAQSQSAEPRVISLNGSSGSMSISGASNITASNNNSTITVYGPANILNSFSIGGNTGTTGSSAITGGGFVIAGGSNVTLSQSNNSISIHGASQSVQTQSTHVHIISGNTSGTTASMSTGTIVLAGGNNITLSQNANSVTVSALASSSLVQSGNVSISTNGSTITISGLGFAYASLSAGNTSGTLALISSGTMYLAGGNNITLSQVGNAVTISGPNVAGAQTGISGIIGSDATYTSGTVEFTGSNIVTVRSSAGQRIVIDASFSQSLQTQSTHVHIISGNTSGTTASMSTGTIVLAGGNNVTLSQNGNSITFLGMDFYAGTQINNTTYISFVDSNNVSFGMDIGAHITATATFAQSAEPRVISLNGTSGSLSLSGASNITVSALNGSTITIYGPANILNSFSIGGNTGTTGSSAISGGGFVLAGGSNITLSQSNATISIHGGAGGGGAVIAAGTQTGNTSGTVIFSNSNNVSFGMINNSIVTATATLVRISIGISNLGNTLGSSTPLVSRRFVFVGSDNITLSQSTNGESSGTLTILGASNIVSDVNIAGNTSGATADITSGTLILAGGNNITLSQAGNAITISGREVPTLSIWDNFFLRTGFGFYDAADRFALEELDIVDDVFPGNMTVSTAFFDVSATVNAGGTDNFGTVKLGIYTLNASTLSIHNSVSTAWSLGPLTGGGPQFITIHSSLWSASPTFSQTKYWLGYIFHTHSDAAFSMSILGQSHLFTGARVGTFPSTLTISTAGQVPFVGTSAATRANTAALPTNIQLSELVKSGGNYGIMPHLVFMNVSSNF